MRSSAATMQQLSSWEKGLAALIRYTRPLIEWSAALDRVAPSVLYLGCTHAQCVCVCVSR